MERTLISELYKTYNGVEAVAVAGWVRSVRDSKSLAFVELSDGSGVRGVQLVVPDTLDGFARIAKLNVGAAITARGKVVVTPQARQPFEIAAERIEVEGDSAPDYPLQKKRHSLEFLRTLTALRPRTNTFQSVFRIRSEISFAIHDFFHSRGFVYVHTPLITGSDAEGAGEMFKLEGDFFGVPTSLTVSGQLEGEAFAQAFSNIYTFGPTFRAENSNTPRHAAEFWMVEPEMAFCDIHGDMDIAEAMVKHILRHVLSVCPAELEFLNSFVDKTLLARLDNVLNSAFERITYTRAIELLEKAAGETPGRFRYPVFWGCDLQTEHERYISEEICGKPVFLIDYPKEIKAFYMRANDDGKTAAAMDLLVPGVGELIGGSQREERPDNLLARMKETGMPAEAYESYLALRRYGTTRHAGFGLGLERMVMYVTGMANIRDVIPYPRTAGSLL